MFSIIPPDIIPMYESQLIGAVKKYIIVADNITIPPIISKYDTNFAIDITWSRSMIPNKCFVIYSLRLEMALERLSVTN